MNYLQNICLFTALVKLSLPESFGSAAPFKRVTDFAAHLFKLWNVDCRTMYFFWNIAKVLAHLCGDEVKSVKETAHVGIGVLGFHHVGHLDKAKDSSNIHFYEIHVMSVMITLSQLKAVPKAPALTPIRTNWPMDLDPTTFGGLINVD